MAQASVLVLLYPLLLVIPWSACSDPRDYGSPSHPVRARVAKAIVVRVPLHEPSASHEASEMASVHYGSSSLESHRPQYEGDGRNYPQQDQQKLVIVLPSGQADSHVAPELRGRGPSSDTYKETGHRQQIQPAPSRYNYSKDTSYRSSSSEDSGKNSDYVASYQGRGSSTHQGDAPLYQGHDPSTRTYIYDTYQQGASEQSQSKDAGQVTSHQPQQHSKDLGHAYQGQQASSSLQGYGKEEGHATSVQPMDPHSGQHAPAYSKEINQAHKGHQTSQYNNAYSKENRPSRRPELYRYVPSTQTYALAKDAGQDSGAYQSTYSNQEHFKYTNQDSGYHKAVEQQDTRSPSSRTQVQSKDYSGTGIQAKKAEYQAYQSYKDVTYSNAPQQQQQQQRLTAARKQSASATSQQVPLILITLNKNRKASTGGATAYETGYGSEGGRQTSSSGDQEANYRQQEGSSGHHTGHVSTVNKQNSENLPAKTSQSQHPSVGYGSTPQSQSGSYPAKKKHNRYAGAGYGSGGFSQPTIHVAKISPSHESSGGDYSGRSHSASGFGSATGYATSSQAAKSTPDHASSSYGSGLSQQTGYDSTTDGSTGQRSSPPGYGSTTVYSSSSYDTASVGKQQNVSWHSKTDISSGRDIKTKAIQYAALSGGWEAKPSRQETTSLPKNVASSGSWEVKPPIWEKTSQYEAKPTRQETATQYGGWVEKPTRSEVTSQSQYASPSVGWETKPTRSEVTSQSQYASPSVGWEGKPSREHNAYSQWESKWSGSRHTFDGQDIYPQPQQTTQQQMESQTYSEPQTLSSQIYEPDNQEHQLDDATTGTSRTKKKASVGDRTKGIVLLLVGGNDDFDRRSGDDDSELPTDLVTSADDVIVA